VVETTTASTGLQKQYLSSTESENRVTLSTGTLYGALKRLLDQGWIIRIEESGLEASGRERKVYQLTEHGRKVLSDEIARLQKLLMAAEQRALEEPT